MTFLRNIGADLIEKRLWPIAVALLVALVAVPSILGKSASESSSTLQVTPIAGVASAQPETVLALNTKPAGRRKRGGVPKNPFVQLFVPKPAPIAAAAPLDVGAAPVIGGTDPGVVAVGPEAPKPAKRPKLQVYKATLRFGQAGSMRTIRDIPRLTPLPSIDNPFFVFIGVKEGGATLVFLVSSDAKATGDGVCQPTETCETIEMKAGDTEFFEVVTDKGVEQFQLDVVSVRKAKASSAVAARKAHARQSKAGAAMLDAARDGAGNPERIGRYLWDARSGVMRVVSTKLDASGKASRKAKASRKRRAAGIAGRAISRTTSVP